MSWIISSVDIQSMQFCKYEKWYFYSDKISELQNKKVLIEGDFYYHEHLFLNRIVSFPDTVEGSYAIALLDDNFILCASDCISTRNIYYFQNNELFFVSSSLRLILNAVANCAQLVLDSSYLYTYFVYGNNQYRTPYKGIQKLPAGYCIRIADTIYVYPYINFDAELENVRKKTKNKDKAQYAVEILKSHCKKISEKYKNGTLLIEISGGVDSSLLAGLLHEEVQDKSLSLNGYSYTYHNQVIGNELLFMRDVARKNGIYNHIVTDLNLDSFHILQECNEAFPDMAVMNAGLFCRTRDVVLAADATVSGQGGDICIGDYYNAFADKTSIFTSAYRDSMYYEKFFLKTLMAKYICPVYFGNIIPYQKLSREAYPLWLTDKMQKIANRTLNHAFRSICGNTKSYGMRIALFDYLEYNGLVSDDILPYVCYFPYFTRDMIAFGRVFNDDYVEGGSYRRKIKSATRKYLPLSVYLRKGKSRMDVVCQQAFAKNASTYRDLVAESVLLHKLSIKKEQVWNEIQKIADGKDYNISYSLRLLSLLVWHKALCSKYPTE